jgi:hypothetical protein
MVKLVLEYLFYCWIMCYLHYLGVFLHYTVDANFQVWLLITPWAEG